MGSWTSRLLRTFNNKTRVTG